MIPSYLSFGGVDFPIVVRGPYVELKSNLSELKVLTLALDHMVYADSRDVPLDDLTHHGFRVQELSAQPVAPADSVESLLDGPINWRRLSGRWPDLSDLFFVRSGFLPRKLVVPRAVLMNLVAKLREFRDGVANGTLEPRVADDPVPSPRPLTPELEEYERLRTISQVDAEEYRLELYARRG